MQIGQVYPNKDDVIGFISTIITRVEKISDTKKVVGELKKIQNNLFSEIIVINARFVEIEDKLSMLPEKAITEIRSMQFNSTREIGRIVYYLNRSKHFTNWISTHWRLLTQSGGLNKTEQEERTLFLRDLNDREIYHSAVFSKLYLNGHSSQAILHMRLIKKVCKTVRLNYSFFYTHAGETALREKDIPTALNCTKSGVYTSECRAKVIRDFFADTFSSSFEPAADAFEKKDICNLQIPVLGFNIHSQWVQQAGIDSLLTFALNIENLNRRKSALQSCILWYLFTLNFSRLVPWLWLILTRMPNSKNDNEGFSNLILDFIDRTDLRNVEKTLDLWLDFILEIEDIELRNLCLAKYLQSDFANDNRTLENAIRCFRHLNLEFEERNSIEAWLKKIFEGYFSPYNAAKVPLNELLHLVCDYLYEFPATIATHENLLKIVKQLEGHELVAARLKILIEKPVTPIQVNLGLSPRLVSRYVFFSLINKGNIREFWMSKLFEMAESMKTYEQMFLKLACVSKMINPKNVQVYFKDAVEKFSKRIGHEKKVELDEYFVWLKIQFACNRKDMLPLVTEILNEIENMLKKAYGAPNSKV